MKKQNHTNTYYTPVQLRLPLDIGKIIETSDPLYVFNEVMEHIDLRKHIADERNCKTGRPRYDSIKLLKIILFAFMEYGYCAVRFIEKLCKTDIRFMWLLDEAKAPSFMTIENFMKDILVGTLDEIVAEINEYIFETESVDTNHVYLDGTKVEANANKYTWVWKKSCIKSRNKVFMKLNEALSEVNEQLMICKRAKLESHQEYEIEYVEYIMETYLSAMNVSVENFVYGSGKRKSKEQRLYEQLSEYCERLKKYAERIRICGDNRNSYSKTDHDATFMRVKKDYMGNDQLLPAYNFQTAISDGYVVMHHAYAYASDMDCFQPMMEAFNERYHFYPEYPVADAGYGSFNNYLYCETHGMKKYMKFSTYDKLSKDEKYRDNPYRAVNFKIDEGNMVCPNGKKFYFLKKQPVKGNKYGRTEEVYKCEDCKDCGHREKCHKSADDRIVRINEELTQIHNEVLGNLNSVHGALLRMNRSIQSEGTFGEIKWNRAYRRLRRRGEEAVNFEFGLICCGFNLHKLYLARQAKKKAA